VRLWFFRWRCSLLEDTLTRVKKIELAQRDERKSTRAEEE
jgi:hypothetical protein